MLCYDKIFLEKRMVREVKIMNIRRAIKEDIPRINQLLKQVLMVHHYGRPDLFKADVKKYTDEQLQDILKDPMTPVFVAVDEKGTLFGYTFCIIQCRENDNILTDGKTLYIDDLCVDQSFRGQHIGRRFYEYVLDYARREKCYNVTLNVWTCNENAMRFYEKCGLRPQKIGMEIIL